MNQAAQLIHLFINAANLCLLLIHQHRYQPEGHCRPFTADIPTLPRTRQWPALHGVDAAFKSLCKGMHMSSNTTVVNLTAQITALSTALRIVIDASPNAAQVREQLSTALDKTIHDALEEGVWDNADGVKTIKAALLG